MTPLEILKLYSTERYNILEYFDKFVERYAESYHKVVLNKPKRIFDYPCNYFVENDNLLFDTDYFDCGYSIHLSCLDMTDKELLEYTMERYKEEIRQEEEKEKKRMEQNEQAEYNRYLKLKEKFENVRTNNQTI